MRVTLVGTGYVGTVTGACLAYLGHRVTCVDTDESKIAILQRCESPIYEPYLEEILRWELYHPLVAQEFPPPSGVPRPDGIQQVSLLVTSSAVIKYAANAFLAMKNRLRQRDRQYLRAGRRSCFGKDIHALLRIAQECGYESKLLTRLARREPKLYIIKGRTIALLPDTDDLRDAPSLYSAGQLLQMGAREGVRPHRHDGVQAAA